MPLCQNKCMFCSVLYLDKTTGGLVDEDEEEEELEEGEITVGSQKIKGPHTTGNILQ